MTTEIPADKIPFDLWINGNEGRLQLAATFRTGRTRMRVEALGAAFFAGQRAEREKLEIAFVQGVKWWEYNRTGGTMWASDRRLAEKEARVRSRNGELGETNKVR